MYEPYQKLSTIDQALGDLFQQAVCPGQIACFYAGPMRLRSKYSEPLTDSCEKLRKPLCDMTEYFRETCVITKLTSTPHC